MKRVLCRFFLCIGFLLFPLQVPAAEVEAELRVSNLACGSCVIRIDHTVKGLDGADGISRYDLPNRKVWFSYNSQKITAQTIADAINELGYSAEVLNDGLQAE